MKFLNAVAWTGLALSLLWFALIVYGAGVSRTALQLALVYRAMERRALFYVLLFALSVLWLIFGG